MSLIKNAVKTIYASRADMLERYKLPFNVSQYSTINEKFNLGNSNPPGSGYPKLGYLTIGRGGLSIVSDGQGGVIVNNLYHEPDDACLKTHLPFIVVPENNDLSDAQRLKYRCRVLINNGSANYYAYYVKVIDLSSITDSTDVITVSNGVISSQSSYTPSVNNLNPTLTDISNDQLNSSTGTHIQSALSLNIDLTTDIQNIIDGVIAIYGDDSKATISELGFVAGYDTSVTTTYLGNSITYNEIQCGQVHYFLAANDDLRMKSSLSYNFSLSVRNPLPPTV